MSVLSVMMGGSVPRYLADYAWIFIIAGICSFIEIHNISQANETKILLKKIFGVLVIYTVLINLCACMVEDTTHVKKNSPNQYYNIIYSINYWQ